MSYYSTLQCMTLEQMNRLREHLFGIRRPRLKLKREALCAFVQTSIFAHCLREGTIQDVAMAVLQSTQTPFPHSTS